MNKKYEVVGEFGPIASMSISRRYLASCPENAKKMFINRISKTMPELWKKIGPNNIYVLSGWDKDRYTTEILK